MHTAIQPGALVQVRGCPWVLRSDVGRADCRELHLEPAAGHGGASAGGPIVLLAPFDRPVALAPPGRLRAVSRRAWMAALRTAILGQREPGSLCAAARADVDLLQHQLEPALAVVRHGARRLLLADAVGLGKTIEAGLVLIELRARSALDRVLVLAPPGLCNQWCAELEDRFGLEPVVADTGWLRSLRPVLPASINPWSVPGIHVASLDFAKRPEVRRSLERVSWDAVIVDEAHSRQATANAVRPQTLLPPGPASCCCSPPRRTAGIIGPFMRSAASARLAANDPDCHVPQDSGGRRHLAQAARAPASHRGRRSRASPSAGNSTTTSGRCGRSAEARRAATRASR